jgi:hypothetical protein
MLEFSMSTKNLRKVEVVCNADGSHPLVKKKNFDLNTVLVDVVQEAVPDLLINAVAVTLDEIAIEAGVEAVLLIGMTCLLFICTDFQF